MLKQIIILSLVFFISLANEVNLQKLIVTSNTNEAQDIDDITSDFDIVTQEDIELGNYQNIDELLNELAGINLTKSGTIGQVASLYLRGMSAKSVVVLIDGIRANDPTG